MRTKKEYILEKSLLLIAFYMIFGLIVYLGHTSLDTIQIFPYLNNINDIPNDHTLWIWIFNESFTMIFFYTLGFGILISINYIILKYRNLCITKVEKIFYILILIYFAFNLLNILFFTGGYNSLSDSLYNLFPNSRIIDFIFNSTNKVLFISFSCLIFFYSKYSYLFYGAFILFNIVAIYRKSKTIKLP